ncbi:MAG TPA: tripartite tricarboxylate transporter substrate-binding protein [Pseudolabrys sp.]|jgi:tripartite-type tricarboxylate transporter receptor subunit TctC|nr:tripartite tricarboxylate transporter substrate-binding protein [Pseudolabrys sp.]
MQYHGAVKILACLTWLIACSAPVWGQANFFEGKTVTVLIGAKSGSLEIAAQIVSHHLGKYLPGKPAVILQHMPGAAHLLATNNVFNVAKPDGLTILAANPNVAIAQLSKVEQVRFDVRKFQWLGSSGADGVMLSIRSDLPFKSFDELKKADRELVAGTTGPGSNAHDFPLLLKEFAGLKLKLVSGYPSNSDVLLAIERKEVDSWSALATTIKLGAERGAVRPLVRGRVALAGFENLPIDEDLATSALGKSLMGIKSIPGAIGRAFAVAPGTPADRVAILRDAFAKAIKDPELIAEAQKAKIEMQFISAEQVLKDFNAMMNQTPETLKEMGKYIKAES